MSTTIEKIQRQIAENPILLYMKGSPKLPSCGFSAQAVQALAACGERFAYVDICRTRTFVRNCLNMLTGRPSRNCGLTASW